jgi:hypothetical protein
MSLIAAINFDIAFLAVLWLIYIICYWLALQQILRATKFEAHDKILWFLVITFAPVLGLLSYWMLCPDFVRNKQP